MADRLRDIPVLNQDGSNLKQWADGVREIVQTFRGYRGNKLDQALTRRDAVSSDGFLVQQGITGVIPGAPAPGGSPGPPGPPAVDVPDLTAPPTPTGLAVTAGIAHIYVAHDTPVYTQGHGHDRTVVYGAKWADGAPVVPTFTDAVRLFDFQGTFGAYPSDPDTRWCIWIKWLSIDGVQSATPAGGANGAQATTGENMGPLLISLGTAWIDDAMIANLSAAKLTAGSGVIGGPLKSSNYLSGSAGWLLQPTGFAEFSNAVIRGATYTGTIFAGAGQIGGITISAADLRSTNYVPGTSGFRINADGSAEFYNVTARGNITANSLNAATGTFTGSLVAVGGTFGNVTINAGGALHSGQTAFNTGTGFWLGFDGSTATFSLGNPSGEHLTWDGLHLGITDPSFGPFTATITGGDFGSLTTGFILKAPGQQPYATRTVAVSGGKAPYTYLWIVSNGSTFDSRAITDQMILSQVYIAGGTSTLQTVSVHGANNGHSNQARLICFVTDVNGRTTVASCGFYVTHTFASSGGTGGGDGGP